MGEIRKIKIFVSAYACEPWKGSEIGVGWHWALEMSKYFELWVMTRANNQQPIEKYFFEHPEEDNGIHWVYYDCPNYVKRFKRQMRGVRTYYTLWQILSDSLVKEIMEKNQIEIFHLLTYGNAIWHVSNYGQKQFFVWGPTGGVDIIENEFSRHYSWKHRVVEFVRRCVVKSLRYSICFHNRCKNANLILCKANSTLNIIPEKYRKKAILFTDVAMEKNIINSVQPVKNSEKLVFLTVGKLDGWRGFDLILEAFPKVLEQMPKAELHIMGDGAERRHIEDIIKSKKLTKNVKLLGQVPMETYQREMKMCDVVVNACLKEGAVTNAFDCMSFGKPLLCINTGGYTRNFDDTCAIILPRKIMRNEMIEELSNGMVKMLDYNTRMILQKNIIRRGEKITWEIKGHQIAETIKSAYLNREG